MNDSMRHIQILFLALAFCYGVRGAFAGGSSSSCDEGRSDVEDEQCRVTIQDLPYDLVLKVLSEPEDYGRSFLKK